MTFDGATTDPMQCAVRDALIASMAATAHAQAEATKAAQRAGIEHAKASDDRVYLGRKPSYTRKQLAQVQAMLGQYGIAAIAKEAGLSRQTVYRIQDDPAGAEVALAVWEGLKETNPIQRGVVEAFYILTDGSAGLLPGVPLG